MRKFSGGSKSRVNRVGVNVRSGRRDSGHGLSSVAVFGRDVNRAPAVARRIGAGIRHVNLSSDRISTGSATASTG